MWIHVFINTSAKIKFSKIFFHYKYIRAFVYLFVLFYKANDWNGCCHANCRPPTSSQIKYSKRFPLHLPNWKQLIFLLLLFCAEFNNYFHWAVSSFQYHFLERKNEMKFYLNFAFSTATLECVWAYSSWNYIL